MKGKKDHYDLNCIGQKTKCITAHLFVEKRTLRMCAELLSQIKKTSHEQILEGYARGKNEPKDRQKRITFVSDKFCNYKTAWSRLFYRVTKLTFGVPIAYKKYGLKHNNNPIERENGNVKDRIKIMRGGFGSFEGAESFLNLRHLIHNFASPHQ